MTVEDEGYEIDVHVVSELVEKIFLNIPADWLKRLVGTDSLLVIEKGSKVHNGSKIFNHRQF